MRPVEPFLVNPPPRVHVAVRLFVGIAIGAAVLALLLGRGRRFASATRQLGHMRPGFVVLAIVAEGMSVVAFARLQRLLLESGGVRTRTSRLLAITLGGSALQNSFPAGAAWSSAFAFRQFRRLGADSLLAGWVVVVEGFLVLATVAAVAGLGLVSSVPGRVPLLPVGVFLGLALIAVTVGWWYGTRRDDARLASPLRALLPRLRSLSPRPRTWLMAETLASLNLLADCACLALAFLAVSQRVPWPGLLTAYAVGQFGSRLPITPGGLGLVEGGITASLAAYGVPAAHSIAAVLVYRLISYWGLTLVGWPAILWLTRSEPELRVLEQPNASSA